ncbi:MAG: TIGR04283 family arsenosugar biosynthesis glycosyltransferase [Nitrospinae bacterium]|nr:TIGR04283 family arsenosugar biosynthesis glycosyltransferase [Nitrospinota bacterium]
MSVAPVGVVIPAFREGDRVARTVAALRYGGFDGPVVASLVEGDDETIPPTGAGVTVVFGPAGRGGQMNRGAALLDVGTILFLHADTAVDPAVAAPLDDRLRRANAVAGAFTLAFDARGIGYRLAERMVALRSRWLALPYGDQGLFVRKGAFDRVGGYPDIPLMEEVALLDRLRRIGRIVILPERAVTSARRYAKRGIVRTTVSNAWTLAAYRMGADPARLYERYYRERA